MFCCITIRAAQLKTHLLQIKDSDNCAKILIFGPCGASLPGFKLMAQTISFGKIIYLCGSINKEKFNRYG